MEFDPISKQVLQAALKVHSELGPGLFEEVYKVRGAIGGHSQSATAHLFEAGKKRNWTAAEFQHRPSAAGNRESR